jgi:hypothetical protein
MAVARDATDAERKELAALTLLPLWDLFRNNRSPFPIVILTDRPRVTPGQVKFSTFRTLAGGAHAGPNRICETTNTINSSMTPGLIDEHFIEHHLAKARGGTGWMAAKPGSSTSLSTKRPTRSAWSTSHRTTPPVKAHSRRA